MPHVHPSAVLSGDIQLADDVVIGPHCVLAGTIRIGPGTTLIAGVHLHGPLWIGARNVCYPGVCLGFAPQDLKFDPSKHGAGLVVGDGNTFREHVTISRATKEDAPTTIGNDNYWMAGSHAGHDARVGNNCIMGNGVAFGGHSVVGDRVVFGGLSAIHQFARVGRLCMLSGLAGLSSDLPPFCLLTGINTLSGLNLVGMRRAGIPRDAIDHVRWAFRTLWRRGTSPKKTVHDLAERAHVPEVKEIMDFVLSAKRPIVDRLGRARHTALNLRRDVRDDDPTSSSGEAGDA
jgi:UDP-N-acetylglucosamine acyltransferase